MIVFTAEQRQALRELAELWGSTRFCLIGASALACQMDFNRQTNDLDISVSVTLDEVATRLSTLTGWKRNPKKEHEWRSPAGIQVDVLPAGESLLATGEVVWPESGARMNLAGLRLAFEKSFPFEIEHGVSIPLAPVAVIALLKMISYLDRPHERERDLEDLAQILENYVLPDDMRRFAPEVIEAGVSYEAASAYLLGEDLAALTNDGERRLVETFVGRVSDEHHASGTQARMARLGPASWKQEPDELMERIDAFSAGFQH